MISSVICSSMRTRSARVRASPSSSDDAAEDLLDLAADLDLVRQVEPRVELLDDPALDPELDVPERLADRRGGEERGPRAFPRRGGAPPGGRERATRPGCGRRRGPPGPGALDALQEGHASASARLGTLASARAAARTPLMTLAEREDPSPPLRPSTLRRGRRAASPTRDRAILRTCPATPASRGCSSTNGTPRLSAYTTVRPSLMIWWSILRPIDCSTSAPGCRGRSRRGSGPARSAPAGSRAAPRPRGRGGCS